MTPDAQGVTGANFPTAFTAVPTVSVTVQTSSTSATLVQIISVTVSQVTMRILRQNATTGIFNPAPQVQIHVIASG